ncbi:hypothetical protein M7I_6366 [Glarea lozoyensis 74030]|uniref:Uncharacterized protein n=1 Tax=Glarea lozoyensis (strain ATCC 74030 / MF5533) TaxID=1104152 RepID=H0EUD2_GLAL7|nr:hypothetical protein M7I_6366 [Glarea lozoyensis 74030]
MSVNEFYVWIFGTYLPTRYPKMFVLHPTSVENLVNKEHIPRTPPTSSLEALKIMGSHIDHDFLFMLPSEDGEGYILEGFVVCFPSGFDTSKKCGMTLREIHGPVPNYKEKLALSMDRFFDRLEVGKVVKRANWTITTTDELFKPGGTHLYEGEEAEPEDVDISRHIFKVHPKIGIGVIQTDDYK